MTPESFRTPSGVEVTRIRNEVVSANTYVLQATGTVGDVCLVVDPGSDTETLQGVLRGVSVTPVVLLTHGHFDHVLGVPHLQENGSVVYMAGADARFLRRNNFYMRALSVDHTTQSFPFVDLSESQPEIAALTVLDTPGHSPGSVSFRFHDALVTGDTILSRHILSPTIAGCDEGQQIASVEGLLDEFTDGTVVLPGHGQPGTLEQLVSRNDDLRTVIEYMRGEE